MITHLLQIQCIIISYTVDATVWHTVCDTTVDTHPLWTLPFQPDPYRTTQWKCAVRHQPLDPTMFGLILYTSVKAPFGTLTMSC